MLSALRGNSLLPVRSLPPEAAADRAERLLTILRGQPGWDKSKKSSPRTRAAEIPNLKFTLLPAPGLSPMCGYTEGA